MKNLDKLTDLHYDEDLRDVWLFDEINQQTARDTIRCLYLLQAKKKDQINLHILTEGGSSDCMFALHDAISSMSCHIKAFCYGEISSAGTIVLLACDEKVCFTHTQFMLHNLQCGGEDTDIILAESRLKASLQLQEMVVDIYVKKLGISKKSIQSKLNKEFYLTAQEALEVGLVDEIILDE